MTSNSKELIELAERCEKASGPETQVEWEYPLEADIFEAVKGPAWDRLYRQGALPCGAPDETCRQYARQRAPRYTASLDAAMTLVPEGWVLLALNQRTPFEIAEAKKTSVDPNEWAEWSATFRLISDERPYRLRSSELRQGCAATPALALCAAALRARATQSPVDEGTDHA